MPKFEITFRDEIDAENEDEAIAWLFQYLTDCVNDGDVSVFEFYELKENKNA